MIRTVMRNFDHFSGREGLFLVFIAVMLCLGLSISYSLGILPLEGVFLCLVLPVVFLLFLVRQEAMLLAIVAAYFGAGYLFPELLTQSLVRSALLLLMGLMLILRSGVTKTITRVSTPLDKMVFLWLVVIFISLFYGLYRGNETRYLIGDLYKFVEIISVFWLTTFIVKTGRQIRFLIWGFLFVVLVLGAIDLMTFFSRVSLVGGVLGARVRAGAQFSSIFAIILVITLILHQKRRRARAILTFLGFAFFLSFIVSFLRTGYIVLPIALIVVLLLYFYRNGSRSLAGAKNLVLLLTFLLVFLVLSSMIITSTNPDIDLVEATFARLGSLVEPTTTGSPWGVRILEIRSIISGALTESPLFGNGLGGKYFSASGFTGEFKWSEKHYVHNNYFDFIMRTGILGLFVFLVIAFRYLKDAIAFYLKSKDSFFQAVLLASIGIFIATSIIALSTSIFYSPFPFLIMAVTYCIASLEGQKSSGAHKVE
jgi:O-antigen ligase